MVGFKFIGIPTDVLIKYISNAWLWSNIFYFEHLKHWNFDVDFTYSINLF